MCRRKPFFQETCFSLDNDFTPSKLTATNITCFGHWNNRSSSLRTWRQKKERAHSSVFEGHLAQGRTSIQWIKLRLEGVVGRRCRQLSTPGECRLLAFCTWPAATPSGRTLQHNHLVSEVPNLFYPKPYDLNQKNGMPRSPQRRGDGCFRSGIRHLWDTISQFG